MPQLQWVLLNQVSGRQAGLYGGHRKRNRERTHMWAAGPNFGGPIRIESKAPPSEGFPSVTQQGCDSLRVWGCLILNPSREKEGEPDHL